MSDTKISQLPSASSLTGTEILPLVQGSTTKQALLYSIQSVPQTSIVTSGGTTTLTAASSAQQVFTGSSSQTVVLDTATTFPNGKRFWINNNSSGSITLNNKAGTTLYTFPAGGYGVINLLDNSTTNGTWDIHPQAPSTVTWGSGTTGLIFNTALTTTPSISAGISSAANPSFIPQRGSPTTGYGGDSTHLYGSISGAAAFTATATGFTVPAAFGCNGASAQTAYASGGALATYGAGTNGFDTAGHAQALYNLVVAIRAALVANGIMS